MLPPLPAPPPLPSPAVDSHFMQTVLKPGRCGGMHRDMRGDFGNIFPHRILHLHTNLQRLSCRIAAMRHESSNQNRRFSESKASTVTPTPALVRMTLFTCTLKCTTPHTAVRRKRCPRAAYPTAHRIAARTSGHDRQSHAPGHKPAHYMKQISIKIKPHRKKAACGCAGDGTLRLLITVQRKQMRKQEGKGRKGKGGRAAALAHHRE